MASLSLEPTTSGPFAIGDTVSFALVGTDLPAVPAFFDLTYDASLLSYQGAEFDSRLDFVHRSGRASRRERRNHAGKHPGGVLRQ